MKLPAALFRRYFSCHSAILASGLGKQTGTKRSGGSTCNLLPYCNSEASILRESCYQHIYELKQSGKS